MGIRREIHLGKLQVRINWLVLVCVCFAVLGLGRLGVWQLDRAAEKVAEQEALNARLQDNAPALESIPDGQLNRLNPQLQNLHVSLKGEYLNDKTILIPGEFFDSQIGYGVITPFRLASNDELVLVSRGWTTGILPPDTPPYLNPVDGPVEVTGQIHVRPENARVFSSEVDPSSWPLRMRTLEFDVVSQILGEPIFPFEVRLTADQAGTLVRHWPAVNINVNQNLFYAVQWFMFALIVLIIALFASSNLWKLMREMPDRP